MKPPPGVDLGSDALHPLLEGIEDKALLGQARLKGGELAALSAEGGIVAIPGAAGDQGQPQGRDRGRHHPAGGREADDTGAIPALDDHLHPLEASFAH